MKHEILELQFNDLTARSTRLMKRGVLPFVKRNPIWAAAIAFSLFSAIYWLFIASDRYISEAHVIVERTELTGGNPTDLAGLITGVSSTSRADQLILRDYLRSIDMVRKLDVELNLRDHYSTFGIDPFSKLKSDPTIEELHRYFLSRVEIEFDDYTGVLIIRAEGFDPATAQEITKALVRQGEQFMNAMAHRLAQDQVSFLERQVALLNRRAMDARRAVLDYQNKHGLVSPETATETISGIIAQLEGQRTEMETKLRSLQSYLVSDHPSIVQLEQQIGAINRQIEEETGKLTSSGGGKLNAQMEKFQRLKMEASFALDLYKSALVALEKGRVEGTRTIKKMSIVQMPTLPESVEKPRRIYNTILYVIIAILVAGVANLILAIINDHRD